MTIAVQFIKSLAVFCREYDWNRHRWKNLDKTKIVWPFRVMVHPFAGFDEMKYSGRGSLALANIIMLLLFLEQILSFSSTGFIFNKNRSEDFNIFLEFLKADGILLLWWISNWMVCTLLDGEGKLKEIWNATWYSMMPKVMFGLPILLLSRIFVVEEAPFIAIAGNVALGWSILLLLISVMVTHQYTFRQTILASLLTLFCMTVLVFIIILFFSFFQQMLMFLETLYKEFLSRI